MQTNIVILIIVILVVCGMGLALLYNQSKPALPPPAPTVTQPTSGTAPTSVTAPNPGPVPTPGPVPPAPAPPPAPNRVTEARSKAQKKCNDLTNFVEFELREKGKLLPIIFRGRPDEITQDVVSETKSEIDRRAKICAGRMVLMHDENIEKIKNHFRFWIISRAFSPHMYNSKYQTIYRELMTKFVLENGLNDFDEEPHRGDLKYELENGYMPEFRVLSLALQKAKIEVDIKMNDSIKDLYRTFHKIKKDEEEE